MTQIDHLAADYWDRNLEANPTSATIIGDRRFDHLLDDISPEATERILSHYRRIQAEAEAIDESRLDHQDRITRSMLVSETQSDIDMIETGVLYGACDPNTGVLVGLLQAAGQTVATTPENAAALLERYRQVPRLFDQALERHLVEFAAGRAPTATNISRVVSQLDGYLGSESADDPIAQTAGPEDWDGLGKWRGQLEQIATEIVRPALTKYREGVAQLAVHGRDDDHPGLCHIERGEEDYLRAIRTFTSLPFTAQELHEIGREEAEGRLADEFRALGENALGTTDLAEVLDRLRNDPTLRYANAAEITSDAESYVSRSWAAAPDWFNLRPSANCEVKEVPAALAKDVPPAYYFPPATDGSRPGIYFINTHDASGRARYSGEAVAYHEASPGHHFQLTLSTELTDLPEFRKHALTYAFVEGWGLYSERLADEMSLYTDDLMRLGMVSADAWRACRLVVDTGIHAMGWTRQQAVDYMHKWCAIDEPSVQVEVDRYIGMPGQALAYKVGQREIFRLREKAQVDLGDRFDIKDFHDVCLGSGNITLPILSDLVGAWVGRAGST
ncbi:MAG TPA: DUF885 domain-containing protein [Acidimicrobiia bacterium]|nr:DUF885 domain-containing protein [Acidimicrobiia bacterium]